MNKNRKRKYPAIAAANKNAKRKSAEGHPKVGWPNKPQDMRGPTIREQMEMLGQIPKTN